MKERNFLYEKGKISVSGGVEKKVQKKVFGLCLAQAAAAMLPMKNNFLLSPQNSQLSHTKHNENKKGEIKRKKEKKFSLWHNYRAAAKYVTFLFFNFVAASMLFFVFLAEESSLE